MFKLTKDEQKLVAFVVGVLVLGTAVKHWRATHPAVPAAHVESKGQ